MVWLKTCVILKTMNKNLTRLLSVLILFLALEAGLSACSLAIHDWKLVFYLKIPVSAPLFPLAEVNFLNANFKVKPTDEVFWISDHGFLGHFLAGFVKALPVWPAELNWHLGDNARPVLATARMHAEKDRPPLILGSDRNFIKIAFFSDQNADFNCHQLVVMQTSRIRGVYTGKDHPWAQEINGMSWFSLIFYQIPLPDRVLSLAVFPFKFTRISLFEDHGYVEGLLAQKLLKRRPDLEVDPFVFDFPELPE